MPKTPTGTETRKISRHETGARTPLSTRPMVEPATTEDVVDAERHAALALRKGIGEDRRGVGDQHRTTLKTLTDPHRDQPLRPGPALHPLSPMGRTEKAVKTTNPRL